MFGMDKPVISLSILVLFLLQSLYRVLVNSYDPVDHFAVNCGSSGKIKCYGRNWVGDIHPKLFSTIEPQHVQPSLIANAPSSPSVDAVPFGTARLFRSQFTYSFPLKTNAPKFVRLHFYATTYLNFESYNSLFSVTAANFTLLKDFNASLWLVHGDTPFFKEYCINVITGQRLDITFIPSIDIHHPDAYAFINGIEVVSMPPFLYYTNLSIDDMGFKLVGQAGTIPYKLQSDRALETVYRVNVGHNQVPPGQDTGMFRNWDTDFPLYLQEEHPWSVQSAFGLQLNYLNNTVPNYTAPEAVYLTARSYGKYAITDYKVSWNFEVDSDFIYMVRLHFCVWDPSVRNNGDLIFQIFIAETMAEESADVIGWGGGNLVPVYRDYAVFMFTQGLSVPKKVNLSIKLGRVLSNKTRISDVILNGIELFKISDGDNLAGPNPDPVPSPDQVSQAQPFIQSSKISKETITIAIIAVVAVSSLIILASVVGVLVFLRRGKGLEKEGNTKTEEPSHLGHYFSISMAETRSAAAPSLPTHLCRYFSIAEIRAATNNFDDACIVGEGGFGNVYRGYIDDGATSVAIKRLKPGSQQGVNEFLNEIEMLSQLRHVHLVSLIGYCNDDVEMILVFEFMQRGTLREYLYGSDNQPLPWKQRLEILLGAARGLHYLHAGAKHNVIHRDVKSTNILLDEKWVAKVSDFGLSRVGPNGKSTTHLSTIVKGSLGYVDPEYYKRQRLTIKYDVYSFGVVLLEALCARPPLICRVEKDKDKASLVDWVKKCHHRGELDQTVDPFLKDSITSECLKWYSQMTLNCLHDNGSQRPSMNDVVGGLEFALQLADAMKGVRAGGTQGEEIEIAK